MISNSKKEFILNRICIFVGQDLDPNSDSEVASVLQRRFDIRLPQRRSMDESLASTTSDHEIISLILQYRALDK
ncbi:hypothetical protein [Marinomonas transparens]|uniref:Uncharacterized protein n=1 Tax=Marinomonas transparens TaxID=2795388 RepID=A0A934N3S4_9GAMM|nr:hypothetical protein [Marinomonas transparens]MBJ7539318.1 hypothetical protein [Marinomonas transparens]